MPKLIFPLGHYMGEFYPRVGEPRKHHIVRVGRGSPKLRDEDHMAMWGLLHPPAMMIEAVPTWDRATVEQLAVDMGVGNVAELVDELLFLGLAVEVDTSGDELVDFARRHRLRTLLHGLGNTFADQEQFGIGTVETGPVIAVGAQEYELWQWAAMTPTLWDTYQLLVAVWSHDEVTHPLNTDCAERLRADTESLRLHRLIGQGAAYLDESAP